jgi:thiosulfate sulfurtransferase
MNNFQRISVQTAKELIDTAPVTKIVDIRDPQSFQVGRMTQAQHLTNDNVQQFITQTEKSLPIIVCCYHGNSSQGAADFIAQQGFEQVYSLDGGFEEWEAKYPELTERS